MMALVTTFAGSCSRGPGVPQWLTPRGGGPFVVSLGGTHMTLPAFRAATDQRIARLQLPTGFRLEVFARGLRNPRMMVVAPDGTAYVTRMKQGDVVMLPDRNHDGRADEARVVASGLEQVHGIALREGLMYLATPHDVFTAAVRTDGTLSPVRRLYEAFPPGGRHPNRSLAFGPDHWLYLSTGSTCNVCVESDPESGAMLRMRPDGGGREIFARGLRNTIGFDWEPTTGALWGMDNGSDERGDSVPPEELNSIVANGEYGWPYCFGERTLDTRAVADLHPASAPDCRETAGPVSLYTAHSAPMSFVFYRGTQFPEPYRHDAFITLHGSWNRSEPSGYKVVRLHFVDGRPAGFEDFLTGYFDAHEFSQFGRPMGLAVTPDGALLVGDDANGVIYRVVWTGPAT